MAQKEITVFYRGGFAMWLPPSSSEWTLKKRRYNELCYLCRRKCKSHGKSVPNIGRVCDDCFYGLVIDGVSLNVEILGDKALPIAEPSMLGDFYYTPYKVPSKRIEVRILEEAAS